MRTNPFEGAGEGRIGALVETPVMSSARTHGPVAA
jgi:hypothetical protein